MVEPGDLPSRYPNNEAIAPAVTEADLLGVETDPSELEGIEYRRLSPEEESHLVDLLDQRRADRKLGPTEKRYSVYLLDGNDPSVALARGVELEVFEEKFSNGPELMNEAYGPYEESSRFLVVIDNENKRCAGVERIIVNSEAGFMSLNDVESYRDDDGELVWGKPQSEIMEENDITQEDLERTWDMGTLAVRPEYRKTNVSLALYHASNNAARMEGITHWVCIVQNDVLAMFESMSLDLRPFKGVGSGMYLGTPSTPVHLWFGAAEKRAFEENRFTYDFVVKGEGVGFEDTVDFADIKNPKGSE